MDGFQPKDVIDQGTATGRKQKRVLGLIMNGIQLRVFLATLRMLDKVGKLDRLFVMIGELHCHGVCRMQSGERISYHRPNQIVLMDMWILKYGLAVDDL